MSDATLKNSLPAVMTIPESDADALLRAGDGDAALLYLYLMRRGGGVDTAAAARDMGRSDRDMAMAAARLTRLGLLSGAPRSAPLAPEDEAPEYDAREIARRSMEDEQFRDLVQEVQLSLGRSLSRPDLNRLFAIYSDLALPAEVILLLVQYCKDESLRLNGPGRTVGMAFVYRVGREWFDAELMTYELAEQWLRDREARRSAYGQLRQELGVGDREFSKTERSYLDAWLDMGFPPAAIGIAADRTVAQKGGLKWPYANAILRSWHEKGLHTPAEIEAGDGKKTGAKQKDSAPIPARDDTDALAQIRRVREKLKNG